MIKSKNKEDEKEKETIEPQESYEKKLEEAGQIKLIEPPANTPRGLTDEQLEAYDSLINRGVTVKKAEELAKNYELKRIKRNLKDAVKQKETSRNLPGLIISMIEADTAGQQEIAKREARARIDARQKDRTHLGRARDDRAGEQEQKQKEKQKPNPNKLSDDEVQFVINFNSIPSFLREKTKRLGLTLEDIKSGKRK